MAEPGEPADPSVPSPDPPVSRSAGRPRRGAVIPLLIGLLAGVVLALAGVLLIGGPMAVAHRNDAPLERLYGRAAVGIAARLNAGNQTNPSASNPGSVQTGRAAYTGSCAVCHGADGKGKGVFGDASYPPATDLTSGDAAEKSDAQLYWIIQNGLSFTAMPAFNQQYDSNGIWALVSYIRGLQHGQAGAEVVPTPTLDQLAQADPQGDQTQRGAAIYFAEGCQNCHGANGNAPGELALRGGGREAQQALRHGRPGMPVYGPSQISDSQLADLTAYLNTFGGRRNADAPGFAATLELAPSTALH